MGNKMTISNDTRGKIRHQNPRKLDAPPGTFVRKSNMKHHNTPSDVGAIFFAPSDNQGLRFVNLPDEDELGYAFSDLAQWYEGRA